MLVPGATRVAEWVPWPGAIAAAFQAAGGELRTTAGCDTITTANGKGNGNRTGQWRGD